MKPWRLLGSSPTIWLTLDRLTQQAIWLLLFAILAPILGPKPYGLFTIVMAFIGFCEMVIVGGAVEALVTIPEATDSHFRTVNLAGVVAAVIAGGAVFAAAGPIANFFEAPELEQLFRVLAPLPVISALTAIPVAVLSSTHAVSRAGLALNRRLGGERDDRSGSGLVRRRRLGARCPSARPTLHRIGNLVGIGSHATRVWMVAIEFS